MIDIVVGFIVAVFKSVIPYGAVRLYRYIKIEKHIRVFFKNFSKEEICIVVPPADVDPIIKGTQILDFLGIMEIQEMFTSQGFKLRRIRADKIAENDKKSNLLLIGGPIPNPVTKSLLERKEIVYKFGGPDGHSIINDKGLKIDPRMERGRITHDLGIITRMKNPYNPDKDVIMVCGSYGWGTQAALKILKDRDSLKYLNQYNQHFQIICTCEVDEDNVGLKPHLLDLCPDESFKFNSIIELYGRN